MKNLLLYLTTISLFFISCSKSDPEIETGEIFSISGEINGEPISVEANTCQTAGWTGFLSATNGTLKIWETNWSIIQEGHEFNIEFQVHDSLLFFNEEKAGEYFFPRTVEPSLFPKFFSIIEYSDGAKRYSSTPEWWEKIGQDFHLEIEEVVDLDYQHDCTDLAPMLHLKGNFNGPLINVSDSTEQIIVENGKFDVILRRYE